MWKRALAAGRTTVNKLVLAAIAALYSSSAPASTFTGNQMNDYCQNPAQKPAVSFYIAGVADKGFQDYLILLTSTKNLLDFKQSTEIGDQFHGYCIKGNLLLPKVDVFCLYLEKHPES